MPSPPLLLLTTDDRLARIESLLVAVGTTVDRIERLASRMTFKRASRMENDEGVEILACGIAGAASKSRLCLMGGDWFIGSRQTKRSGWLRRCQRSGAFRGFIFVLIELPLA
jgi:hypothetical protein